MKVIVAVLALVMGYSCTIEDGRDLNGPETSSISEGVSRAELPQVVAGILSDMRDRLGTQIDGVSVLGRDYWRHQGSDPRWVGDLLVGNVDNNTFYTTAPYATRYAVVKECNILLEGMINTTEPFSDGERAAIRGFANTMKAHELLAVLQLQYQNGIRTDVSDPDNLGDFESYDGALSTIIDLLTSAASDLAIGGDVYPNTLGVSYLEFNKAITARAAAYQKNYPLVLSALQGSFMDMTTDASMYIGAFHKFSLTGADVPNPLFFGLNSSAANSRIAHPDFVSSAENGDTRAAKAVFRELEIEDTGVFEPNPLSISDLSGSHDVFIYESNTSPVGIIRNEELILLFAEASMVSNQAGAVNAVNVVRNAAGLGPVISVDEDRLLHERRYSLFAEGHRWIDMRRFDRLSELIIDRSGDNIVSQFPIPQNEGQ